MDWIDPKVELIYENDTLTEDDLFEEMAEHDSQRVICRSGSLIQTLADSARSCELVSPEGENLVDISAFNSENQNVRTENSFVDTNFGENMFHFSGLGSDSVDLLSPNQFNGSDTEWLLSEYEGSNLEKITFDRTAHDKGVNSTKHGSYESRRSYCLGNSNSKNAIAARDNRLKKKKYITDLENAVSNLQVENEHLREQSKKHCQTLGLLQNEVSYLRKVIANQSTLSAILKNVMKTPGITLTTSFNNAVNCKSSKMEAMTSDDSCKKNTRGCKKKVNCVDAFGQVGSVLDLNAATSSSTKSRKASQRNVKEKEVHVQSQKKTGSIQKEKQPAAIDSETFGDSEESDVSTDNIHGGVCLHVSGHHVSLEFCPHCNKNAYLGLITDHSYVKL